MGVDNRELVAFGVSPRPNALFINFMTYSTNDTSCHYFILMYRLFKYN